MAGDGTYCLDNAAKAASNIHLAVVGGSEELRAALQDRLGERCESLRHLKAGDWNETGWQEARPAGTLWAVVALDMPLETVVRWTQLISVTLRPNRLVVVSPTDRPADHVALSRLGDIGIVRRGANAEEILAELDAPVAESDRQNPEECLRALMRASEELFPTSDPAGQLSRLLKIFKTQLKVDRATVILKDGDKARLAAGFGLPEDLKIGDTIELKPDSIVSWVMVHRQPRLIEGSYSGGSRRSEVRSAVCAPLQVRDELLGAVSFSSMKGGRQFTPADLSTISVFATMLAFSLSNQRLVEDNVKKERLAAIGRTTATIAHCMKNIVQILEGSVFLLREPARQEPQGVVGKGHHLVDRATQRLQHLVHELLEFSAARTPELRPADPAQVVQEALDDHLIDPWINTHRFEVRLDNSRTILLDDRRLVRALANLLGNSLDETKGGGRVLLGVEWEGDWVKFSVSDSGDGVPEDKLARIFDAFYSTKGSRGTGLGLAMVKKFCEENGGWAEASRDAELGGLKVTIVLPVIEAPVASLEHCEA